MSLADGYETGAAAAPHLALHFVQSRAGRTELATRHVSYPWSLTQPFYLDSAPRGMATIIPQSCSGGLYRDDRLVQEISVADGAAVHVSTQGATLVHAARGGREAFSAWRLGVAGRGVLEFVASPLVLGGQAALRQAFDLTIAPAARLLLVDAWTWLDVDGRAAFERFHSEVRLKRPDGLVMAKEQSVITAQSLERQRAASSAPIGAFAMAIIAGHAGGAAWPALGGDLAAAMEALPGCWTGVSELPGGCGLILRAVCSSAERLQPWSQLVWHQLRRHDYGVTPPSRRRGL